jgi:UDPglucose 6-dehydrogenase
MKITIVGTGYVGLSNAILLAQHNEVVALDPLPAKVDQINQRISPIEESDISHYLAHKSLKLRATLNPADAYAGADIVIVATPTNFDEVTNQFDTRSIEAVLADVMLLAPQALIVIKSTVPVGCTQRLREQTGSANIIFSPAHNLHPSRIVVGEQSERAAAFAALLQQGAAKPSIDVLLCGSNEAESIKLFVIPH